MSATVTEEGQVAVLPEASLTTKVAVIGAPTTVVKSAQV